MRRTALAFLDMLLLILLLRHEPAPAEAMMGKPVADYLIEIQWPPERADDIDLYVMTPDGEVCFFQNRDLNGLVTLERDDLGHRNDASPFNREFIALRSPKPGTYYVSVHNYRKGGALTGDETVAFEITTKDGRTVVGGRVPMPLKRQEQIIGQFTINERGHFTRWSSDGTRIVGRVLR